MEQERGQQKLPEGSGHAVTYDRRDTPRERSRHRARCLGPTCGWASEWAKSLEDAMDLADAHREAVGVVA